MKLSDIVYPFTIPNLEFAALVYHRKIFYSNAHRIPTNKPILFVSNHPTAFLEPVVYAGLLDRPIHPLVRGNFFEHRMARTALESLKMIPIFRMRDGGIQGLRKNAKTFQFCYDLLADEKNVLIMAEGVAQQQKRLGPIQKGAARIALGAASGRKLDDLMIVPLGANFTEADAFRKEVMIEVGDPIAVADYLPQYLADKKPMVDKLTMDIEARMKQTIVHIADKLDEPLFEKVIHIARRSLPSTLWPSWNRSDKRFQLEKKWAEVINGLPNDQKVKLDEFVSKYDKDVLLRSNNYLLNAVIMLLGVPFWLLGACYRFIPFSIGRWIVSSKVEKLEFKSPVRFGMGMLFTGLWSLLVLLTIAWTLGAKWIWLPLFMLLVIWFSLIYEDLWLVVKQSVHWSKMSVVQRSQLQTIEHRLILGDEEVDFSNWVCNSNIDLLGPELRNRKRI